MSDTLPTTLPMLRAFAAEPAPIERPVAIEITPGEPALARLRFTHRQRRALENVQFALEQELC